jgi:Initiator Replication protein
MAKIKKKSLPASLIVTQANELVSARYTLPLAEQRLVLSMIARIQPDDEDFKEYRVNIGELADFVGVDKNSAYRECKKITESLLKRILKIEEPGRLLQAGWVSSADYIDGEGCVILCFDPKLKPYLLQLKGNFTSCKLEMLLSFKSQYTMRVYTLLKQYERVKEREIKLDQLREILGLRKDLHVEYSNFKNKILLPVQKELESKADLTFEFDEIKYGRRIGAIRFHIVTKKPIESLVDDTLTALIPDLLPPDVQATILSAPHLPTQEVPITAPVDKLMAIVPEQHRAKKTVQTALAAFEKKHGFEYVKRNIVYCNAKAAKSYAGFLVNTLKEDWGHDWQLEQNVPVKPKPLELWERNGFASEKEYNDVMFRQQMQKYGKLGECAAALI